MYHSNSGMHCNPFGTKTSSTANIPDSTESKESKSILAPAHFRPFNAGTSSISSTSKFILRPSSLFTHTSNLTDNETVSESSNEASIKCSSEETLGNSNKASSSSTDVKSSECSDSSSKVADSLASVSSSTDECSFPSLASKSNLESNNSGFVFGQNIHERVVNVDEEASSSVASNETTELSFAHTASASQVDLSKPESDSSNEGSSERLCESAKKYESRHIKRTYDEVAVVTGEEDESNVLQVNCKLYIFDKLTSTWHERGRGLLRLNDKDVFDSKGHIQSRIVMRTQGSLRVVLNSKIWPAMSIEKPSPKTVRVTAQDADGIKVYLIQANAKDADQLYHALEWRVVALKRHEEEESLNKSEDVDSTTESANESPSKKVKLEESCEADTSSDPQNTSSSQSI